MATINTASSTRAIPEIARTTTLFLVGACLGATGACSASDVTNSRTPRVVLVASAGMATATGNSGGSPSPSSLGSGGTGGRAATGGVNNAGLGGRSSGGSGAGGAPSSGGGVNNEPTGGQSNMTGGASTGGTGGGSVACSAVFCEDFEGGTLDPKVWTQHSSNGSVALQSSKVAHGQQAAHFHMDPGKANAYISESKTYPALDREAYGRMYFRIEPAGPPSHTVFVSGGIMDGTAHLELGNYDGGWQLTFWSPNKGEDIGVGTASYPVNQWSCIEWHFNDRPGEIEVWVDGVSRGSKTRTENDWTDGFKEIAFGLYLFSSVDHATDLYLDDIVLNNQRVGCLPP